MNKKLCIISRHGGKTHSWRHMERPMEHIKRIIKKLLPKGLWPVIRRKLIIIRHGIVARKLSPIVNSVISCNVPKIVFNRKQNLPENGKIIWQYWAQGYDDQSVPELVNICLKSVEKHTGDYMLIRLSDENLSQYIELPSFIKENKQNIPIAQFSDFLRLLLLSIYGGVWLDACILLTGDLPNLLGDSDFFMYQRSDEEPFKEYWENSFAYYFGWHKGFRVNVLSGIMYANPRSEVIRDLYHMVALCLKKFNKIPHYFFFHILYDLYMEQFPSRNCPIANDCIPHMLRQVVNAEYPYKSVQEILAITPVHSLNYKNPDAAIRLKEILGSVC